MNEKAKELPACPVETTLTLIGDKWYERESKRTSGLPCGNHLDIDRRQMEGADIKRFDAGNKAFWRTEKVHRHGVAKGVDRTAS